MVVVVAAAVVMVSLQVASQKHTAREIKQRQRGRHTAQAAARQRSSGGENVRAERACALALPVQTD